tara:strand:+ start:4531 stop:4923 length:393 start_codon:yes stop_codon:yes gene_type:complete
MLRFISKTLVLVLALWAILLGVCAVLGIQIYFPFTISEENQIPYFRMQAVRIAVFMTFVYYAAMYLVNASKEVYPIHFLKIFMVCLSISSFIFTYQYSASLSNYIIATFFILCGIIFHLVSKPEIKKYFT